MNHANFTVFLILRRLFVLIHSMFFLILVVKVVLKNYILTLCA